MEDDDQNSDWEDRLSLEATDWIAKRDRGFSGEEQDRFFEWLNADERHRDMYRRRASFWQNTRLLSDWRPDHSDEPNPDLLVAHQKSGIAWVRKWVAPIAAALVIAGLGSLILVRDGGQDEQVLELDMADSYANHILADGSIVEMNRGTSVSVRFSEHRRLVYLLEGEAHFTVAKNTKRPFLVKAGDAVVEATGTAFNVALRENGLEVLVTEGSVRLNTASDEKNGPRSEPSQSVIAELVAGQRSVLEGSVEQSVSTVERVSVAEIEERLSWKAEILDFTDEPLANVVAAFNRRNVRQLSVADASIRDLEITARIKSNNLEAFLGLLSEAMGVQALESKDQALIRLVKRP